MRRHREPLPRARHPWSWLSGFLTFGFIVAGMAAAAMILWENVDIQRLTRVPGDARAVALPDPMPPLAPAVADPMPGIAFEVAIYRSSATGDFFPEAEFYPEVLARWDTIVTDMGGRVRPIEGAAAVDALAGRGLVIAPAAVCLSNAEAASLRAHADRGGSLLLTWATGARNGQCEWLGWDVVQELTGARDVREVERRDALFLTVPAENPLSPGLPPASRVELRWDAPLAIATEAVRVYWSDWALNPAAADGTASVDAAAATRETTAGGRIVWFGFMEHHAVEALDRERLRQLLENGVRWAARIPTAELLPWPHGARAGFVLAASVAGEFRNAGTLAAAAVARAIPATFFAVSQLAAAHPGLAAEFSAAGEIGSQTSDNAFLVGLPEGEQRTRLRRARSEIEDWAGAEPTGLRPPEEGADAATLEAWRALGGSYVVGLNGGRTGSPELIQTDQGPIVLLPRSIKDDYNLLIQERTLRPEAVVREVEDGLRKMRALGGLALLTLHTELAIQPRYLEAILDRIGSVTAEGGWWTATGEEVAEWTLARATATVEMRRPSADRLEIVITAPDDRPLTGGWVTVDLPTEAGWTPAFGEGPGTYAVSGRGLELPVGDLLPGESRILVLTHPSEVSVAPEL